MLWLQAQVASDWFVTQAEEASLLLLALDMSWCVRNHTVLFNDPVWIRVPKQPWAPPPESSLCTAVLPCPRIAAL